jgi:hypothetical protein
MRLDVTYRFIQSRSGLNSWCDLFTYNRTRSKNAHGKLIFVRVFMVAIEIRNYDDFMSFTKEANPIN